MTDTDRGALLEILTQTPARLKDSLKGVPKKLLLWTPGPGKWSILEIVAHMRDMERDAYLWRYRKILAEDTPSLPDLDGDVLAIRETYRELNLRDLVRDWVKLRKECLKLLKSVKGEKWERIGTHETAGPLSMEDFLRRHAIGNDEAHLSQIQAIKNRASVFETLAAGPAKASSLTKPLPDDALRRRPAPDKWSAMEIVCHLRDVERVWADRLVKVAFSEKPQFFILEVDALAKKNEYNAQDLGAALKEYARLREDNLRLLRALPAAQWKRAGIHPKHGEVTIERTAERMIEHDRNHLDQVEKAAGTVR